MSYLRTVLRSTAFKKKPVRTLKNALKLCLDLATKRGRVLDVSYGGKSFKFQYTHGAKHGGGRGIYVFREHIEDLMEYGHQFLSDGDVVIDGGANQGVFTTAFASKVGASGRVIAFEPMEYAVAKIHKNLTLNGFENTTVIQKGLSDKTGSATLDLGRGVGSASITNDYGGGNTVTIETTNIDTEVANLNIDRLDFIKLDIEGAELMALHGARETIDKYHPTICMEISVGSGSDQEIKAHEHLLGLGYEAFEFVNGELCKMTTLNPPIPNVFYIYPKS